MILVHLYNSNDTLYDQLKIQFKQVRWIPNVMKYLSDISSNNTQDLHMGSSGAIQSIKKELKLVQNTVIENIISNCSANITILLKT